MPAETSLDRAKEGSAAVRFATRIADAGIDGMRGVAGSEALARTYLHNPAFPTNHARADALAHREIGKNFGTGFATSFGGFATLPVTVPAGMASSWIIQARMAGAIAHLYAHPLTDDRVRTLVLLSLLGRKGVDLVDAAGVDIGRGVSRHMAKRLPLNLVIDIKQRIGTRMLAQASRHGATRLTRLIPVAGSVVGGVADAAACRTVAQTAKELFRV